MHRFWEIQGIRDKVTVSNQFIAQTFSDTETLDTEKTSLFTFLFSYFHMGFGDH